MFRFSIRDMLWLTVVVGLIVGHFVTLHSQLPWKVLREEKATHAQQVQELHAMLEQKDEELRTLRAESATALRLAGKESAADSDP
jgi:uncharacterized membrane-anchored protein YhcB (DUF1043 family)